MSMSSPTAEEVSSSLKHDYDIITLVQSEGHGHGTFCETSGYM